MRHEGVGVTWEGLSPPYGTIVADPPWHYEQGGPHSLTGRGVAVDVPPYSTMTTYEVAVMPVSEIAAPSAHLYLWTTNRYIERAYDIARAWGFMPSQLLTWCKPPHGLGPGGAFANTTEFCLFSRRNCPHRDRIDSTWWEWPRGRHSAKPPAFLDMVERVSPGPYVELFARAPRLGWDHWGKGYELGAA